MSSRKRRRGGIPAHLLTEGLEELMFGGPARAGHKTHQLCEQVSEAIEYAFATAASPLLRDLRVVAVESVRSTALVRVLVTTEQSHVDISEIEGALVRAHGYLRGEVAQAIHRKRVPGLEVIVVPPEVSRE